MQRSVWDTGCVDIGGLWRVQGNMRLILCLKYCSYRATTLTNTNQLPSLPIEVGCSLLSAPKNGAVGFSETTVGSQAFYSCNSGFVLVGDRVRVCLAGGRWSNEVPVCQGKLHIK